MFLEAMDLHRAFNFNSNLMDSSHSKIISNERWCPVTRADMNEPSRPYKLALPLLCGVRYVIVDEFSWELLIHCYVTEQW